VVTWTTDADHVVAHAFGFDLAALYGWWLAAR
jgi:hypothetical protein